MNMRPNEMIEGIPKFESSDGYSINLTDDFLKEKLYRAINNSRIINLARGEGRSLALNDIIIHPEILFDWGEKSMHSFLDSQDENVRKFCDPNVINKKLMIEYIEKYADFLKKYIHRYRELKIDGNYALMIKQLVNCIRNENNNEKLLIFKEWLIYAFHTMGIKEFSKITPCISCSYGQNRFNIAQKFGWNNARNKYYVIMDCWVKCIDEGITYRKTNYVNSMLECFGLKWFKNYNSEVMLKYAIFPQQLVGYYFVDHGKVTKYVVNKHYLDKWEKNVDFEIGMPIYFDQNIDFNDLGPYNTVYQYNQGVFSIVGRRN